MVSIYDYTRLTEFLNAHFVDKQSQDERWSYRMWSKQLGFKYNTTLLKIINGQRVPSHQTSSALLNYFNFSSRGEIDYFEQLVNFERYRDNPRMQEMIRSIMHDLQRVHRERTSGEKSDYTQEEHSASIPTMWWTYGLVSILNFRTIKYDYATIRQEFLFELSESDFEQGMQQLLECGIVQINDKGELEQLRNFWVSERTSSASTICRDQSTLNAISANLEQLNALEDFMATLVTTIAFDQDSLEVFKEKLKQVFLDVERYEEVAKPDRHYLFQLHFLPMIKKT